MFKDFKTIHIQKVNIIYNYLQLNSQHDALTALHYVHKQKQLVSKPFCSKLTPHQGPDDQQQPHQPELERERVRPDRLGKRGAQLFVLLVRLSWSMAIRNHPAHAVPPRTRKALPLQRMHVRQQLEMGRAKAHQKAAPEQCERQNRRNTRPGPLSRPQGPQLFRQRQALDRLTPATHSRVK
jgi:hypothetical protein